MLRFPLVHPPLLRALAEAGHGSTVLVADGNYPTATAVAPGAARVWLNVAPGLLDVVTVAELLTAAVPVEAAAVMAPDGGPDPDVFAAFDLVLAPWSVRPRRLSRSAFYEAARAPDLAVVVATGDQRLFANLLLTIGVVPPPAAASADADPQHQPHTHHPVEGAHP